MTDDLERRLRDSLQRPMLPHAPDALRTRVQDLDYRLLPSPSSVDRRRWWLVTAGLAAAALAVGLVGVIAGSRPPTVVDGLRVMTVSQVLDARAAGGLVDQSVALGGYWSSSSGPASAFNCNPRALLGCGTMPGLIAELEEAPWAIEDGYGMPPAGRYLQPVVPNEVPQRDRLFPEGTRNQPLPIVVVGHFDDPLASQCGSDRYCRDLFVVDRIVYISSAPLHQHTPRPCYATALGPLAGPRAVEDVAGRSQLIGLGVFGGYGTEFWNTSDGQPPPRNQLPEEALILAEVTVDIEQEVRGSPKTLRLAVRGGHLGCSWLSGSDTPFTDPAPRHLFFGSGPYADMSGMPGHFTITDAWPVSNDDIVKTPADGDLPLTEVLLEIADHPAPPASSGPFEREPGVTLESPIPSP